MSVRVTDRSRTYLRRFQEASRYAVDATANTLQANVTRNFGTHYTSQAFRDTLKVRPAIRRTAPYRDAQGNFAARVGIKQGKVGLVALAWELGHHNLFTRKFERVEIWVPTAMDSIPAMQATFTRVLARYLNQPL